MRLGNELVTVLALFALVGAVFPLVLKIVVSYVQRRRETTINIQVSDKDGRLTNIQMKATDEKSIEEFLKKMMDLDIDEPPSKTK